MLNESNNQVVEIAQKVFELLTQGSFTNTYKYATLLGILEALEERSTADGPPSMITSRELAEHVLRIYWPQCDGFRDDPQHGLLPLAQQSGKTARMLSAIQEWRGLHPEQTLAQYFTLYRQAQRTFSTDRVTLPAKSLMDEIELRLIKYAIPLLQYFGDQPQPFLFNWAHPQQPKGIPQYLVGKESKIDNRLQFHNGVPDCLLTLSSLLRSMIQTEWTRHVARIKQNDIETDKLHAFLFDRTRTDLNKTRVPLRELQQQLCFYCNEPLNGETGHVDHFIPWSRHPNDAIENLVVAHSSCNISKSNFLVAPHHLERWKERLGSSAISRIAKEVKWPSERAASISIVQSMYGRLSSGVMVWSSKTKMVELGKDDAKDLLKQLDSLRNSAA